MTFLELGLNQQLLRALSRRGYETPTPVQEQGIPKVLAGTDIMGIAQTGTGKTAAFALPILQQLMTRPAANPRSIRALVLAPTRELAAQIGASFTAYGEHCRIWNTVIFGGVKQNPQVRALRAGVDVLVATPGRLLDLMNQGFVDLRHIEHLVLDEADSMLDMGFIHDIRKIISRIPKQRQTLMFSATMPPEIRTLADAILKNPIRVQVAPTATTAERVSQGVYFVDKADKPAMLVKYLNGNPVRRMLVFTRTKHGADRVVKHLTRSGIAAAAIHGNKSQNVRVRVLESFKSQCPPVLVATDIAARGLDINDVSHVVNYDVPNVPETYVHRIGRTARAGAEGIALAFCDREERTYLRDIEKLTRQSIPVVSAAPVCAQQPCNASPRPEHRPNAHPQAHSQAATHTQHTASAPRNAAAQPSTQRHAHAPVPRHAQSHNQAHTAPHRGGGRTPSGRPSHHAWAKPQESSGRPRKNRSARRKLARAWQ